MLYSRFVVLSLIYFLSAPHIALSSETEKVKLPCNPHNGLYTVEQIEEFIASLESNSDKVIFWVNRLARALPLYTDKHLGDSSEEKRTGYEANYDEISLRDLTLSYRTATSKCLLQKDDGSCSVNYTNSFDTNTKLTKIDFELFQGREPKEKVSMVRASNFSKALRTAIQAAKSKHNSNPPSTYACIQLESLRSSYTMSTEDINFDPTNDDNIDNLLGSREITEMLEGKSSGPVYFHENLVGALSARMFDISVNPENIPKRDDTVYEGYGRWSYRIK